MLKKSLQNHKVLFISINGDPPTSGYGTRVFNMMLSLKKASIDIEILRFYPIFKTKQKWKETCNLHSIPCIELPIPPFSRFAFPRFIGLWIANIITHIFAIIKNASAVQAETQDSAAAVLMHNWSNKPIVIDLHGASSEEALFFHPNIAHKRISWLDRAELKSLKKAAYCWVVSQQMIEHLHNKFPTAQINSCKVIPVSVDPIFFKEQDKISARKQLNVSDSEILFVYCGGNQNYQCIPEMANLFANIITKISARFLIISTNHASFIEHFANFGDKVIYRSATHNEVPGLLCAADVGLLLRSNHIINRVSCPTKAGEYLACGLPIITTPWAGHAPKLAKSFGVGISVDPSLPDLGEIFNFLKNLPSKEHCKQVARQQLDGQLGNKTMLECYEKLLSH